MTEIQEVDGVFCLITESIDEDHIGSVSVRTRIKMAELAADNLVQAIQGERPKYVVNDYR